MRALLAIDPGLNSMGYAYWQPDRHPGSTPSHVGLIKAPRRDLVPRALFCAVTLDRKFNMCRGAGHEIECEMPAYHGSMVGWAAGDVQKLVFLVGVLAGHFDMAKFTPVPPAGWKGQLPKEVVIRRLQNRFGPGATPEWSKD